MLHFDHLYSVYYCSSSSSWCRCKRAERERPSTTIALHSFFLLLLLLLVCVFNVVDWILASIQFSAGYSQRSRRRTSSAAAPEPAARWGLIDVSSLDKCCVCVCVLRERKRLSFPPPPSIPARTRDYAARHLQQRFIGLFLPLLRRADTLPNKTAETFSRPAAVCFFLSCFFFLIFFCNERICFITHERNLTHFSFLSLATGDLFIIFVCVCVLQLSLAKLDRAI